MVTLLVDVQTRRPDLLREMTPGVIWSPLPHQVMECETDSMIRAASIARVATELFDRGVYSVQVGKK